MKGLNVMVAGLLLLGCRSISGSEGTAATTQLRNAAGQVVGTATLTEVTGGVRIVLDMMGAPAGEKGVHIHAVGRCEPPSFESAGSHFNPTSKQHGMQNPQGPHAGDLPNITIAATGTGRLETTTRNITLGPGETSIFDADGSTLVVHEAADDHRTDPAGNTGGRIACGVIAKRGPPGTTAGPGGRSSY